MKVEAVRPLTGMGAVPGRPTVLMPADETAEAGMFDPDRLVEGREVFAVDRFGRREKLRMPIEPQARFGKLQRTEDELHHVLGCLLRRSRLRHFHGMAAVGEIGAAKRIGKRLHPTDIRSLTIGRERRAALAVQIRSFSYGCERQNFHELTFDDLELFLAVQALTLI